MVKKILVLTIALVFGMQYSVFAAGKNDKGNDNPKSASSNNKSDDKKNDDKKSDDKKDDKKYNPPQVPDVDKSKKHVDDEEKGHHDISPVKPPHQDPQPDHGKDSEHGHDSDRGHDSGKGNDSRR